MNNAFAQRLYAQLGQGADNLIFSPTSVSTALAMTYAGAGGTTAKEMAEALSFTLSGEQLHAALSKATSRLASQVAGGAELRIANRLWPRRGLVLEAPFVEITKKYYRAPAELLDYAQLEAARARINGWVRDQTKQKIPELLKLEMLDRATSMVLTNAVYFKGVWQTQFKKAATKQEPFTPATGGAVQTPLMHQTLLAGYRETDDAQVLELPYKAVKPGSELALDLILPKDPQRLSALENELSTVGIASYVSELGERRVDVTLPRFKIAWSRSLNTALQALGMRAAFGAGADFSAMTRSDHSFISLVQHEAFIDVNEEGTEAAAATAVVMTKSPAPQLSVFRADRPFLFLLRDTESGLVLFMGRFARPS
jgi:serpin B